MKNYLLLLVVFLLSLPAIAGNDDLVKVTASAPSQVVEGQRFQLIFTIHNAEADSFRLPKMKSVRLISGPSKNTSYTTKTVGGRMVASRSVSLVYIAVADKKGNISIPAAFIWSGGKKYETNVVDVKVLSQTDQQKKQEEARKKAEQQRNVVPQAKDDEIVAEDAFIKTEWENGDVYAGSSNTLVITLYYRVNVAGWDNIEWPKVKGCEVTDAGVARNSRYGRAKVNGIVYNTVVVGKKDIVPAKAGKLTIDSGELDLIVNVPNKNDFWGGYHRVNKRMVIPGISTKVKPATEKTEPVQEKPTVEPRWNL